MPRILEPGEGRRRVHVSHERDFIIAHRGTEVIDAWSKIVGDFIVAQSAPVALARRNPLRPRPSTRLALRTRTNLQVRNPAKLKQRFGSKTIRDVRFRVG